MSLAEVVVEIPNHPFCKMIAYRRKERGYSWRYICQRVGTASRGYLCHIEHGKFAPTTDIGFALCQVLDIPVHLYIDYHRKYHEAKQRVYIEKSYTEWFEMIPEEVAISMISLAPQESSRAHSQYYNKEYSIS